MNNTTRLERRAQAERRAKQRAYERRVSGGIPDCAVPIATGLLAASVAFLVALVVY